MKFIGILALAFVASPLFAGSLSFTLTPASGTWPIGADAIFSGSVLDTDTTNTCDSDGVGCLFLNDISVAFDPSSPAILSFDLTRNNTFFNSVPGFFSDDGIAANNSYAGPIFGLDLTGAPAGHYTGTVTILGAHDDSSGTDPLASATFTLDITTPEPATFTFALLGIGGVLLAKRRAVR